MCYGKNNWGRWNWKYLRMLSDLCTYFQSICLLSLPLCSWMDAPCPVKRVATLVQITCLSVGGKITCLSTLWTSWWSLLVCHPEGGTSAVRYLYAQHNISLIIYDQVGYSALVWALFPVSWRRCCHSDPGGESDLSGSCKKLFFSHLPQLARAELLLCLGWR